MKNKFILLIIGILIFSSGCAKDDSRNKIESTTPTMQTVSTESVTPTLVPNRSEVTVRNDILLDIHNNDFIFIQGKDMTIDGNSSMMEVDIDNGGNNVLFKISLDTPNGTKIMVYKGDIGVNLLDLFDVEDIEYVNAFDDTGDPKDNYYFQLSAYDLDSDGKKEVIVSVGNLLTELTFVVFKVSDSDDLSFERVGSIAGQSNMYLDKDNHIISPYGSQGLFEEYIYEEGRLLSNQ